MQFASALSCEFLSCFASLFVFSPPQLGLCSRSVHSSLPGISEANLFSRSPPSASCRHLGATTLPHPLTYAPFIDAPKRKKKKATKIRRVGGGGHEQCTHTYKGKQTFSQASEHLIPLNQHADTHTLKKKKQEEKEEKENLLLKFRTIASVMRLAGQSSSAVSSGEMSPKLWGRDGRFDRRLQMRGDRISMRPERGECINRLDWGETGATHKSKSNYEFPGFSFTPPPSFSQEELVSPVWIVRIYFSG